jgi:hypothetical protein
MLAGVARLQMHRAVVLDVMRCGPMMFVGGKAVMVFRMIVIGVQVDVQRSDLAGGRGHNQSEQDSREAIHHHECM